MLSNWIWIKWKTGINIHPYLLGELLKCQTNKSFQASSVVTCCSPSSSWVSLGHVASIDKTQTGTLLRTGLSYCSDKTLDFSLWWPGPRPCAVCATPASWWWSSSSPPSSHPWVRSWSEQWYYTTGWRLKNDQKYDLTVTSFWVLLIRFFF